MGYASTLTTLQGRLSGISYEVISYGTDLVAETANQFPAFGAHLQSAMDVFFDDPDIVGFGDIVDFVKGNSFCSFIKESEYGYAAIRELIWQNFGKYAECETMMNRLAAGIDAYEAAIKALQARFEQFEKTYKPPVVTAPATGDGTTGTAPEPPSALDVFWASEAQATLVEELGKLTDLLNIGLTQAASLRRIILEWLQLGLTASVTYGQVQGIFGTKKTFINENWTVFEALSQYVDDIDAYSPKLTSHYRLCKSIIDTFPPNTPDSEILKALKVKVFEYLCVSEKCESMNAGLQSIFNTLL